MGSYDSTETCELIDRILLSQLQDKFGSKTAIYRGRPFR